MDNKQTIIDNNARIEAITNRLNSSTLADVRDTTATAGDVLVGKEFYGADGQKVSGSIETFTPSEVTENTTLATAGKYVDGDIVINVTGSGSGEDMLQARVDATKSCAYLFYYYSGDNVDYLKGLDTSQVTTMYNMFYASAQLKTIPQLNTTNVKNMGYMFSDCKALNTIPQLDTSNVTFMDRMFYFCESLTEIPQLDTSSVTSMQAMLYHCSKLTSVPQLDMSKTADTQQMFKNCSNITTIPKLDTIEVINMANMFSECYALTTILGLDMIKVTTTSNMFYGCSKLTNLTLKNIKTNLVIGSGTSYGTLLTDESLINTAKELWDLTGSTSKKLTVSTPSNARFDVIYVKLVDVTDEMIAEDEYISNKKPCVVCESTDTGAMTLREYVISKNWSIA